MAFPSIKRKRKRKEKTLNKVTKDLRIDNLPTKMKGDQTDTEETVQ